MAIPDFQTIMRPLMEHLADERGRERQDSVDTLAKQGRLQTVAAARDGHELSRAFTLEALGGLLTLRRLDS
jgi:hypothetical protein